MVKSDAQLVVEVLHIELAADRSDGTGDGHRIGEDPAGTVTDAVTAGCRDIDHRRHDRLDTRCDLDFVADEITAEAVAAPTVYAKHDGGHVLVQEVVERARGPDRDLRREPEGAVDVGNATGGLLSITDVSGVIVHQQTLVPDENGVASFNWSGNKTTGERAAAGQYQLQAFGLVAGRNSALPTQVNASVSSVTVGQGGEGLTLNLQGIGAVDAADVLQIR